MHYSEEKMGIPVLGLQPSLSSNSHDQETALHHGISDATYEQHQPAGTDHSETATTQKETRQPVMLTTAV